MIKRTLEISDGPTFLHIENDQIVLIRDKQEIGRVPCEDVGMLIVDHPAVTSTHGLYVRLAHHGAAAVLCGPNHLPAAMVLPMEDNDLTARRLRIQAAAPLPLRKRLWKQIIRQKIRRQAMNFAADHPMHGRLMALADEVRRGDQSNVEGQAARLYWPALLGPDFRRDPEGLPPNGLLNYGYMVMRAAVARALVAAGLHPVFSLNHHHRHNAFALADDLVEVLRPRVDRTVVECLVEGGGIVDKAAKTRILSLLAAEVKLGDQKGPLMVQLHRLATSLLRCYEGTSKWLDLPVEE
jgi:CRISPR-associated protein Cas1